ncbi:hypothetical protein WICPIJ_003723 [Wickerhamomyces pijperi]|uniref:Golgi apparatus membrane protein TVP38 n=1 Tax=Wickerhamomyces pijperi TaxID=599730 RepID=A0A9P8TNL6_WICPI|nr:hypothetical protein WICPIJ_003723 [Wickerhamomyces pijperi]
MSSTSTSSRYESFKSELYRTAQEFQETAREVWDSRNTLEKVLISLLLIGVGIFAILMVIYHQTILSHVIEYSDKWREGSLAAVLLSVGIFLVSFPPLIGFSLLNTIVGVIYGISFKGWFIIAGSSISGSVLSFLLFRHVFHDQAVKIVNSHQKLSVFNTILKEDNSFWILAMIRLCPLPYSLTNAALAAIPGVSTWNFFLGSLISSPKLALYLFVGTKLKHIGEDRGFWGKFVDILSIVLTMCFVGVTGYVLYWKMTTKLREMDQQQNVMNLDLEQGGELQNLSNHGEDDFLIEEEFDTSTRDNSKRDLLV